VKTGVVKMDSDTVVGFIRGVAYSAAMMKNYHVDSEELLKESGILNSDLLKHADEYDLKILGMIKDD